MKSNINAASSVDFPLVVDLDGTLVLIDTLVESVVLLLKKSPLKFLLLPFWLLSGRARFKEKVAFHISFAVEGLPYNRNLISYLQSEKIKGRPIFLATAAHKSIADSVASHINLFDGVFATDVLRNLKGKNKLEIIREKIGNDFVYAGDSWADLAIWEASRGAVLVGVSKKLANTVEKVVAVEREFPKEKFGIYGYMKTLRVHQWLKNLLIFVPLLMAFSFDEFDKLWLAFLAFFSFSFAASATYIANDLLDLQSDRSHVRKKFRPIARGGIAALHAIVLACFLLAVSLLLAYFVSAGFLGILILYIGATSFYSWVLKEYVLIDVIVLSCLYTLRIIAGSLAVGVMVTSWLLAFSVFLFLSLALIKRCSELVTLEQQGKTEARGRNYAVKDLVILWPMGMASAMAAVVVFCLFINAPETQVRYATPSLLWVVSIGLIYWMGRLWIKTSRGEMHDDPIVYAIKDKGSLVAIFICSCAAAMAHFIKLE